MDEGTIKMSAVDWDESEATSTKPPDSFVPDDSSYVAEEDTELIRAEIEDTRADMSQTINEIQARLSPENVMDQVKDRVREATIGKVEKVMSQVGETIAGVAEPAREAMGKAGTAIKDTGMTVADSMWRNPIPVALIGLGIGMLAMRKYRSDSYSDTPRYSKPRVRRQELVGQSHYDTSSTGTGTGAVAGTLNQVKETASDLANRSTTAITNLGSKAKDSASTLGTRFNEVLRQNPLAVGAVAVAAGTAVGLVLPSTRLEQEYVGETGEMLVDRAQGFAREAMDKVQDAAQQMTEK